MVKAAVTAVMVILAMLALDVSSASAAPSVTAGTASLSSSASSASSAIVASGPGWTIVGSGKKLADSPSAAGNVTPATVYNCGWVTCSVYFSRYDTLRFHSHVQALGGGISALGALCADAVFAGGVAVVAGCAALVILGGAFLLNAINGAAGSDRKSVV